MDIIEKIYGFYNSFKGEKGFIGNTEKGKPIPYFKVEKTRYPKVIAQYSIHAREYITSYLALLQIEDFIKRGERGSVYFIPALNIDGIEIALYDNPLYKANAKGVDLNTNFDARWGKGADNVFSPASENYVGERAFSEAESRALRDFTLKINPDITLSYHSKGEEIYWKFFQEGERKARDYSLAKKLSVSTGYKLVETPDSTGGYKDWCIEKLGISSYTIEVGEDSLTHPICTKHLMGIYLKNKEVLRVITNG